MSISMRFIYLKDGYVCYEYTDNLKHLKVGRVIVSLTNKKDYTLEVYPEAESEYEPFNILATRVIGRVYKFIKENNFPDTSFYAC